MILQLLAFLQTSSLHVALRTKFTHR